MQEEKPFNIVRLVNTYTVSESAFDRSAGKSRKRGITRVTQLQSQGKEAEASSNYCHIPDYHLNDENKNLSNREIPKAGGYQNE